MDTPCQSIEERARKNESIILKALVSAGQGPVSEYIGVDESTVSRWKEKSITQFSMLLASCGLKAVPVTMRCFDPADIDAILHQAHRYMEQVRTADQLGWKE